MQTAPHEYEVRAITPDDAPAVIAIAQANGLVRWEWPVGSHGAVAQVDGTIEAFCAVREILTGVVMDELWCYQTPAGLRGLQLLAQWAEDLTARLGETRGEDLWCGGIVANDLIRHAAALEHRGYVQKAKVYGKQIPRSVGVPSA